MELNGEEHLTFLININHLTVSLDPRSWHRDMNAFILPLAVSVTCAALSVGRQHHFSLLPS